MGLASARGSKRRPTNLLRLHRTTAAILIMDPDGRAKVSWTGCDGKSKGAFSKDIPAVPNCTLRAIPNCTLRAMKVSSWPSTLTTVASGARGACRGRTKTAFIALVPDARLAKEKRPRTTWLSPILLRPEPELLVPPARLLQLCVLRLGLLQDGNVGFGVLPECDPTDRLPIPTRLTASQGPPTG